MPGKSSPREPSMPVTDGAALVGGYPSRRLKDPSAAWLLGQMDRLGIDRAWVGYLPALLYRDPANATPDLLDHIQRHRDRLLPVPTLHPSLPGWEDDLNEALEIGAPAVRVHPRYLGLDPTGGAMRVFVSAASAAGMPFLLT